MEKFQISFFANPIREDADLKCVSYLENEKFYSKILCFFLFISDYMCFANFRFYYVTW